MEHVLDGRGNLIDWDAAQLKGALPGCEGAFIELCANLRGPPLVFPASSASKDLYVENTEGPRMVWKFQVPVHNLSARWLPFLDLSSPEQTFTVEGERMVKSEGEIQLDKRH